MTETMNDTYIRFYHQPLKDWHNGRKYYARKGKPMYEYYQYKLEELPLNAAIVVICGLSALILIAITAILK